MDFSNNPGLWTFGLPFLLVPISFSHFLFAPLALHKVYYLPLRLLPYRRIAGK